MPRPEYFIGSFLSAVDLRAEQEYRQGRLHRHTHMLHDHGVVCGLRVVPARDPARPWAVLVCPGYAIDCCGREIEVPEAARLDIREHLWKHPGGWLKQYYSSLAAETQPTAYVAVRYTEESVHPIPAPPPGCGCEDTVYESSRICDGYRLNVLWNPPPNSKPTADLCAETTPTCPGCTDQLHVILARIALPVSQRDPIAASHIHLREY